MGDWSVRGLVSRNKPGFGRVFRVSPTVRATNPGRGRCRSTEWTVDADGKRVPGGASCPPGAQGDGNGTGSGQACVCLRGRRWHPAVAGGDGGSEERRGGKECVRTCRSWWSPVPSKK